VKERRQNEQDPDITVPNDRRGNGKQWWRETWSKVTAGILILVFGAILTGAWAKAREAAAATAELYNLPPVVERHDAEIKALQTRRPMPPAEVNALADAIAARMKGNKK
jgi:heme A synthase